MPDTAGSSSARSSSADFGAAGFDSICFGGTLVTGLTSSSGSGASNSRAQPIGRRFADCLVRHSPGDFLAAGGF